MLVKPRYVDRNEVVKEAKLTEMGDMGRAQLSEIRWANQSRQSD